MRDPNRRFLGHDRVADELARGLAVVGGEERPEQGGEHRLPFAAGVAERLAAEMDAAALPGAAEHLRDRFLQAGVGVGDDELFPGEAARD